MGSAGSAIREPDRQVGVGRLLYSLLSIYLSHDTLPFLFMITTPPRPCTNIELRSFSSSCFVLCFVRYRGLSHLNFDANLSE